MTRVRIENVVASTSLGFPLDLNAVALTLEGSEYAPDQFPGVIYRLKRPKTAILLFHSGKVVCTGGKSWKEVDESIRIVSGMIRKGGQKILAHPKIEVQNIVATSDLQSELNLQSIAIALGLDRVEYEPEQFPGLVYRLEEPRVVVLLFGSGKLVITGGRRPGDLLGAVEQVKNELEKSGLLAGQRSGTTPSSIRSPPTAPPSAVTPPLASQAPASPPEPSTGTAALSA
jgi:transcription initiation factor TFIID TATA-box-binding protein